MNNPTRSFHLTAIAVAVLTMLFADFARADDEEAAALKTPTNTVEIGVMRTAADSQKFGEYTGTNKAGNHFVGAASIKGGDAYGAEGGVTRWSVEASDLGLTSDTFKATYEKQGSWTLGVGSDELTRNMSQGYKNPYNGAMGGNVFTLPAGFTNGSAVTNAAVNAPYYKPMDVDTTRRNTSVSAGLVLTPRWDVKFDFNHLDQSGAKLMTFPTFASTGVTGQYIAVLPNPTDYTTDTLNLSVNWTGDKGHFSAGYYGSFFTDANDRVTFDTWGGAGAGARVAQNMSTPPSNVFNQFNFAGGYRISPALKWVSDVSVAENTQNSPFLEPKTGGTSLMVVNAPRSSLDGLVRTTHAAFKLTDQASKDLSLSGGFRYDKRDNNTASSLYRFNAVNGTVGDQTNYPNTPLSYEKDQFEVAGDYRIKKDHHLRVAYNHEDVYRWCNQYAVGGVYAAGTNCVVARGSKEDKIDTSYRLKASDSVDLKLAYAWAERHTDSDGAARAAINGSQATVQGLNGGDYVGFYPYFDATRTQQVLKVSSNWQAADALSFGFSTRFTDDKYPSIYGVQRGNSWSVNLDANYAYSETGVFGAYATQQHRERNLYDKTAAGTWENKLTDGDVTVGLNLKQTALWGGKFDLSGDISYTQAATNYFTTTYYTCTSTTTAGAICGQLPIIKSDTTQFKVTGTYHVNKKSSVAMRYMYQELINTDFFYNAYQNAPNGYVAGLMPAGLVAPTYADSVISVLYVFKF
jgi:MtrB/PioB family decaheme-associated outer membrane protein